jgi:predicted  nucleic acid-binding Zn-ribbon protein
MGNEQMQAATKKLQDSMVILDHIEKAHTEHTKDLVQFRIQSDKFRLRIEKNLAEITEKLKRLIG